MEELDPGSLEKLLELIGPYVADMEEMTGWLTERMGRKVEEISEELDKIIEEGGEASSRTDFRILRNALSKI
jgi:hypothetical protein